MKLYLAGQYKQKEELAAVAGQLRAAGHTITARWLQEPHPPNTTLDQIPASQLKKYASLDLTDILDCDMLVAFSVDPSIATHRGGRHVEFGYALGLGKPIIVVGPKENIFHYMDIVIHVPDVKALIRRLKS